MKTAYAEKRKLMGFGHRVYKNGDHRAPILGKLGRAIAAARTATTGLRVVPIEPGTQLGGLHAQGFDLSTQFAQRLRLGVGLGTALPEPPTRVATPSQQQQHLGDVDGKHSRQYQQQLAPRDDDRIHPQPSCKVPDESSCYPDPVASTAASASAVSVASRYARASGWCRPN